MSNGFSIEKTEFDGLKIIKPFFAEDNRGYFLKSYEKDVFKEFGLEGEIFEDFESFSKKNVVRGLHFQTKNPQTKFVRVIFGTVMDVVVDLRKESPTFGKWKSFILSENNHHALWIPAGFAHGFRVLSDEAIVSYKCVGKYEQGFDSGIIWNDTTIGIRWGIEKPIISERDANLQSFAQFCFAINNFEN